MTTDISDLAAGRSCWPRPRGLRAFTISPPLTGALARVLIYVGHQRRRPHPCPPGRDHDDALGRQL